jgi:hypothetical protein
MDVKQSKRRGLGKWGKLLKLPLGPTKITRASGFGTGAIPFAVDVTECKTRNVSLTDHIDFFGHDKRYKPVKRVSQAMEDLIPPLTLHAEVCGKRVYPRHDRP